MSYFFFSFTEMPTNNYVESSFWNFDALFQPQQHPARDAHDTFFLSGRFNSFIVSVTKHLPKKKIWSKNFSHIFVIKAVDLNHFSPKSYFYTPWKRQKTKGFLTFSGCIEV